MGGFVKFLCLCVIWNPWTWAFIILIEFGPNPNHSGFKNDPNKGFRNPCAQIHPIQADQNFEKLISFYINIKKGNKLKSQPK